MKMSSAQLIKIYIERKKQARPGFSSRSLAKAMKVVPSFISALVSGKKTLPLDRIDQLTQLLDLDHLAVKDLKRALVEETLKAHGLDTDELFSSQAAKKYRLAPKSKFSILNPWYNVAIMDLTTCDNFKKDNAWIATRLNISKYQVEQALVQLIQHGLLTETKTGYKKIESKIRLSLNESNSEIRKFHAQMIEKAKEELTTKTSPEAFAKREITGITIATNSKNIAKARLKLTEVLHEVAEILSEGECNELFQINAQMFSLVSEG